MIMICLDVEGVLFPELWVILAQNFGIDELARTTRDEPIYADLMKSRIQSLNNNNIRYSEILKVLRHIEPFDGAVKFLNNLRAENFQISLISDSFYEFLLPLSAQLSFPSIYCHNLIIDKNDSITDWLPRIIDQKPKCVLAFQNLGFKVFAAGDSFNDIGMLSEADGASFMFASPNLAEELPQLPRSNSYSELLRQIKIFEINSRISS